MLGFEIQINDGKPFRVVTGHTLCAFFFFGSSSSESKEMYNNEMRIIGVSADQYHLRWKDRKLVLGDKIKIRVADIANADVVEKKTIKLADLLEEYGRLRQELGDKGLI